MQNVSHLLMLQLLTGIADIVCRATSWSKMFEDGCRRPTYGRTNIACKSCPPAGAPWAPPGLLLLLTLIVCIILFISWCVAVGAVIALYSRAILPLAHIYAGPPCTPLHRLAHHAHTVRPSRHLPRHPLPLLCLIAATISSWHLYIVLLVTRAVVIWHGFGVWVLQERKGEELEEWHEDARWVWRVLCGEEEREILRACGGEASMVKEE
jgi:hypothetical protein